MTEDNGVWAYAITGHTGGTDLSWLTGVAGTEVRLVAAAGLTMLVSDVPLAEFGESALRRNLESLAWLDEVARAHHRVIDAATRLFPVLPTRLATVYSSDTAATAVLSGRCQELRGALRRVSGRAEWGVKAFPVQETGQQQRVPAAADAGAPPERDGSQAPAGAATGTGLAYLRRRRAELAAARESHAAAVADARAVHSTLSGHAELARVHPPQAPQLSGTRVPTLLNASYLIDAGDATAFASVVAAEADAHPALRIELTGPWPPYSFAGEDG